MILYINPLHSQITCLLIQNDKIVNRVDIPKNLDTAEVFPKKLIGLVDAYTVNEIWCIVGPGAFTLMRIITLSINALSMTRTIGLKGIHFFDIIQGGCMPIIEANPRECIIRTNEGDQLFPWSEIPPGKYQGIIETKRFTGGQDFIQYIETVEDIVKTFAQYSQVSRLSPIYFKAPNITCSKQNTSLSSVPTKKS